MSVMTDNGIWSLKKCRRQLDDAHREACNALARFDTDRADNSLPVEARIAARSLLGETALLCESLRTTMNLIPEAAGSNVASALGAEESLAHRANSTLPPMRTAKSLLDQFKAKRGPVATAERYGRPICAAVGLLLGTLGYLEGTIGVNKPAFCAFSNRFSDI